MEPTQQRSNRRKTGFTVRLRGLVGNPRLTPGRGRQGRDDTPTPLGFVVRLLEPASNPAPEGDAVACQQPVIDDPALERQEDRPAQVRDSRTDQVLERIPKGQD